MDIVVINTSKPVLEAVQQKKYKLSSEVAHKLYGYILLVKIIYLINLYRSVFKKVAIYHNEFFGADSAFQMTKTINLSVELFINMILKIQYFALYLTQSCRYVNLIYARLQESSFCALHSIVFLSYMVDSKHWLDKVTRTCKR